MAPDGIHAQVWADGTEHDLDDVHALSMIAAGFASAVIEPPPGDTASDAPAADDSDSEEGDSEGGDGSDDEAGEPDEQPEGEPTERKVVKPKRHKRR